MKGWIKFFLYTFIVVILLGIVTIAPIDREPFKNTPQYQRMMTRLDSLQLNATGRNTLKVGWKKISITPAHTMPMAGYRIRPKFETVHDSLYARIIVLHVGSKPVYLISLDLLLFPPPIKEILSAHFSRNNSSPFLYVSATHTHNGIGGWHNSIVGNFALGKYDEYWVNETAEKIISAIEETEKNLIPATLSYWQTDAAEYAENRVKPGATYDGMLRGITLTRTDSSVAQLITYSAHATSISKKNLSLSGDYPAALVDSVSARSNSFAMFMAGMVGSHRLTGIPHTEYNLIAKAGEVLADKIQHAVATPEKDSVQVVALHIPIEFGTSQLRLSKNWKLRDWLFSELVNPLQGELTYLQLDNIILLGTPCDFSGELFVNHISNTADEENKKVIITSFNGDYVGYITEDYHYETSEKEEVMTLNWVGPDYGNYFSEMITILLRKD